MASIHHPNCHGEKSYAVFSRNEQKALSITVVCSLVIGILGIAMAILTDSQAVLLDGTFNIIYFVMALITLKVSWMVARADDDTHPFGYTWYEPLVNGTKALLIIGLSIMAIVSSIQAIANGGRNIDYGIAVIYGLVATVWCLSVALVLRCLCNSTHENALVKADITNWLVNAAVSGSVFCAFIVIGVLKHFECWVELLPYVDPVIVIAAVILSAYASVSQVWIALKQLLNRAPARAMRDAIKNIVEAAIRQKLNDTHNAHTVTAVHIRIIRPGRWMYVCVYITVSVADFHICSISDLDNIRLAVHTAVNHTFPNAVVDTAFTGDDRWAKPMPIPDLLNFVQQEALERKIPH
eukprot:gene2420-3150_t